jgi:hypothetical protein
MQFNQVSLTRFLNLLAISLTILFAAYVATSAAEISTVHAGARIAEPQGSDAGCQGVISAVEKNFTTPYHMYMTMTSGAVQNGKPRNSEAVFVGGMNYVLVNGKWITTPVSAEDKKATEEAIRKNAKTGTCHYVRDESVNGESTALFATHNQTANGTSDDQIWVSKSKGLIVKQESDIDIGGGRPKSHMSARYEYTNVQAPKM